MDRVKFSPEPRFVWPDGKRCAVMICFDVDGETTALEGGPEIAARLTTMSQTEYGPRIGVPRLLGLLDHLGVPATFFIPSYIAGHHPEMTRAIARAGHEIGAHGHLHEKLAHLDPAQWFEVNPGTADLLKRHGFLYSASMMGDDVPYRHANGLVEIPGQWMLEDWEQFAFNPEPAWGVLPENCEKVYDLWMREYEAMRDFGCCFVLTLHPWLSGRPSRVRLIERVLGDILAEDSAWIANGTAIARHVLDHPGARREITLDPGQAPGR
jgi:peptidoglycan/xylan/chitin deacetylase (PgdA/CDA1 family)